MPRFRSPPKMKKKHSAKWLIILLIFLTFCITLYVRLTPLVSDMAVAAAQNVVTKAINVAVSDKITSGDLDYKGLISFEKDEQGNVTALITDMSKVNMLKSEISYEIIKIITDEKVARIGIPVGNLFGSALLSGTGPSIPVKIVVVSSVSTNFANKFSTAGINQTRHQIFVDVCVNIKVLIPSRSVKTEVHTQLAVAETVIVGHVPESFTYFEGSTEWDTPLEQFDITH
ncbi:MAG: sporulation protein YunB [Clostridiales bacterium]|nr:sporulation protein YunB [Clostridiales bacterium]